MLAYWATGKLQPSVSGKAGSVTGRSPLRVLTKKGICTIEKEGNSVSSLGEAGRKDGRKGREHLACLGSGVRQAGAAGEGAAGDGIQVTRSQRAKQRLSVLPLRPAPQLLFLSRQMQ